MSEIVGMAEVAALRTSLDEARARAERFKKIAADKLCKVPGCEEPWVCAIGWTKPGTPNALCKEHNATDSEWRSRAMQECHANMAERPSRKDRKRTNRDLRGPDMLLAPPLPVGLPKGSLDYQLVVIDRKIARLRNAPAKNPGNPFIAVGNASELQRLYMKRERLQKRQFEESLAHRRVQQAQYEARK